MELLVTFRHAQSSNSLKDHIRDKIVKFDKYLIKPEITHVILNVENGRHCVEINMAENGHNFLAQSDSHDMYVALDEALAKLERQLKKYKEQIKQHKGHLPTARLT